jgi:hypothetical protein
VRAGGFVLGSTLVAAVLVSLAAAGVAAVLVWRIARSAAGEAVAGDTVLPLALYPSALVFTGAYSDALFLALAAGSSSRRRATGAGWPGCSAASRSPRG